MTQKIQHRNKTAPANGRERDSNERSCLRHVCGTGPLPGGNPPCPGQPRLSHGFKASKCTLEVAWTSSSKRTGTTKLHGLKGNYCQIGSRQPTQNKHKVFSQKFDRTCLMFKSVARPATTQKQSIASIASVEGPIQLLRLLSIPLPHHLLTPHLWPNLEPSWPPESHVELEAFFFRQMSGWFSVKNQNYNDIDQSCFLLLTWHSTSFFKLWRQPLLAVHLFSSAFRLCLACGLEHCLGAG